MNPWGLITAHQFAKGITDMISEIDLPKRRRMYNPLWPSPTPTQYRIGRLNNQPEIRPRLTYGYDRRKVRPSEVRPRLDWHDPSPFAHVRPRSPFKGKMKIPRKTKFRPRSPFKGLRVNRPKSTFVANYIRRHTPKGRKLTAKQRGKLLAAAMAARRGVKKRTKKNQYSKRYSPSLSRRSFSRKSYSASRRYSPGFYSPYPLTSNGLVKIYNTAEQIFATGSVNAGSHGIKKSDKFTHKFTSKPGVFGVPKTGKYYLRAGSLVLQGAKSLFKTFGSKELSRGSLR